MKCPRCSHQFEVPEGVPTEVTTGANSSSDLKISVRNLNPQSSLLSGTRARVRGPNKEYSPAFEAAWVQYGRKQEKEESFFRWRLAATTVGGEEPLLRLCLAAFRWQAREWGQEGWKYAPYFHRYLKRRKWEDEPPPAPQAIPRVIDDRLSNGTDRKVAEYRNAQARAATPEQLAELRKATGRG